MASVSERKSDLVIALGLLVFCAVAALFTPDIKNGMSSSAAGPRMIPWMMIGGVAVLSCILVLRSTLAYKRDQQADEVRVEVPVGRSLLIFAAFILLLVAYAASFFPIGYIPATLVTFVAGLWLMGERRWIVLTLFPIIMTSIVYLGFTELLSVWLP
ncbi:tripartite tricarboxylate transporter TctB family protein [Cohaesibacter intestini]|uniref:tripartite tricarboxylate transporter TctB family protein n=1 Tax=Cohaesibacter intestini TaxID=2211145 RepID=UPI000DE99415|nr:tripartite tricarboxylate transporter TctB family protein [Cohaesibacter intestini]